MKKINSIGLVCVIALTICCTLTFGQSTDAVKEATKKNDKKADNDMVDEDVAEFLVKSADARMMDAKEGKLATQKGTTSAIKDYGRLMIKDQDMLLKGIKALAAKKNITLPGALSNKKEDGREDLAEESGHDFDEKFIKMMIIDHERDVKMFKKAMDCKDEEVSSFASKNLPLIEGHLAKIKAIKDQMK